MSPAGISFGAIIRQQSIVPIVLALVVFLALINWFLSPEELTRWLGAMLFLPGIWLGITLWQWSMLRLQRPEDSDARLATARYFSWTMTLFFTVVGVTQVVLLGLEIWVAVAERAPSEILIDRIVGIVLSAVFVFIGNAMPKILTPLSILPRAQAELVTVARRFVGRTLVVLGVVTGLAFLAAPVPFAATLMRFAVIAALVTIVGAVIWMNVAAVRRDE